MVKDILFAVAGYVIGAFTPAVGRKIKALFVKETTAATTAVAAAAPAPVATVVSTIEADVKKVL